MTEFSAIEKTGLLPSTGDSLKTDLGGLGIRNGDLMLVHSSLSALGRVCGGAVGAGKARLIDCVSLVDFAVAWMERNR